MENLELQEVKAILNLIEDGEWANTNPKTLLGFQLNLAIENKIRIYNKTAYELHKSKIKLEKAMDFLYRLTEKGGASKILMEAEDFLIESDFYKKNNI